MYAYKIWGQYYYFLNEFILKNEYFHFERMH